MIPILMGLFAPDGTTEGRVQESQAFYVAALGGNTLSRRGKPMTADAQRTHVRIAVKALADLARDHQIIVPHGNGPQVGRLARQGAAYDADTRLAAGSVGCRNRRQDRLFDRAGADKRLAKERAALTPCPSG